MGRENRRVVLNGQKLGLRWPHKGRSHPKRCLDYLRHGTATGAPAAVGEVQGESGNNFSLIVNSN